MPGLRQPGCRTTILDPNHASAWEYRESMIRQIAVITAIIAAVPLFVGVRTLLTEEYLRGGGIRDSRRPGPDLYGEDAIAMGQKWLVAGVLLAIVSAFLFWRARAWENHE